MRIVVTHVTRMHDGRVCIAGVDTDRLTHVRPVLRSGHLTRDCLFANGGVFALGAEVDLGDVAPCGRPPAVEDHFFELGSARRIGQVDDARLRGLLEALAVDDPHDVFGEALHAPDGFERSFVTNKGEGDASLGVWRPATRPRLRVRGGSRVILECHCGDDQKHFSVTDVRLYQNDLMTVDAAAVRRTRSAIKSSSNVLVCIGLGRSWAPLGAGPPKHWMQVNGIHPATALVAASRADVGVSRNKGDELFERLRVLRKRLADEKGVPTFVIFYDRTMRAIAEQKPSTREEFMAIEGVGNVKFAQYGHIFMRDIAHFVKAASAGAHSRRVDQGLSERVVGAESAASSESLGAHPGSPDLPDMIETISRLASREDDESFDAAKKIVASVGTVLRQVRSLLDSSDERERARAAWILGKLSDSQSVNRLCELLKEDEDSYVRKCAARALGEMGDSSALPALKNAHDTDQTAMVRNRAAAAIRQISESEPAE